MTAHTAKGLEFPVVILADLTCNLAAREPARYPDSDRGLCARRILGCSPWELIEHRDLELERDRAEGIRLAYVAATRARELLVVPAVGAGPFEGGWTSPLDAAIYPTDPRDRPAPAPGCPPLRGPTVLDGPKSGDPRDRRAVLRSGLHRPRAGEHSVVWWDPALLDLEPRAPAGVRASTLLAPDPEGRAEAEGLDLYQDWLDRREDALEAGARPGLRGITVTEAEQPPPASPEAPLEIRVEGLSRPAGRPSGRRFGTLVHTVLRDVPFGPEDGSPSELVAGLVRLHARALGATGAEVEAATGTVLTALAHPLLKRVAGAATVHRELPFQLRLEGGFLVEGTIDLAFREDGRWTVVDFKTDAPGIEGGDGGNADPRYEAYRRQLAWYVHAVAELTGEPAAGVLLLL